jgi:uncharacterized damage-inducible protein DinB
VKKLRGEAEYDIDQEESFAKVSAMTSEIWREQLQRLQQTQEDLLQILSQTTDEKLAEMVSGRDYNFTTLLYGVIQHDVYHTAQIVLLRKL